ncbi:hypothetical protein SAMN05661096_00150 [Marivirga sericea]|uniref:Uncharacterized protein n=1 Tax=Marivirga sericea TaxID=1028 RepID=A0A1X7I2R6_9BACT|nr:hypothetical protein [Marivirga sericea]SMG08676.1 hypothetical protein SAMN05661096_00150 [Marivirga sericea]
MNYLASLLIFCTLIFPSKINNGNQQRAVMQSVFDIEEFQKHLAYSPRFVGTNNRLEVLMVGLPDLENDEVQFEVRNKSIRITSEKEIEELEHHFYIRIDEFDLKKSKARVMLSYQNSRMYYEKEQKILLNAQLLKNSNNEWIVENYNLDEVSINTSD